MLLFQPQQAAPQKCQTELRFLCVLQLSVGNFVKRNIFLSKECLRWSCNSVWARKPSAGLRVCELLGLHSCCLYVLHISLERNETNEATKRQTKLRLCLPESWCESFLPHRSDSFLFVRWANMQTVIKLCINWNLGKVRLTRINQPGLNHLPAVVYEKIKPALHKYVYFATS